MLRSGVGVRRAIAIALAADTVSILTMELMDNAAVLAIPGAMDAVLTDTLFWASLVISLFVAFVVTVPVNRWLIMRGKGHAVVHQLHHGHEDGHGAVARMGRDAHDPTATGAATTHTEDVTAVRTHSGH